MFPAFAFFNPTTFEIAPMDANAGKLYSRFTDLKRKFTNLETWVSNPMYELHVRDAH
jgi:chitinase